MKYLLPPDLRLNDALLALIEGLQAALQSPDATLIKRDSRGEVYRLRSAGQRFAVKWFPPIWQPLDRLPRRLSKKRWPRAIWQRSLRMQDADVPVAPPVAAVTTDSWAGEGYLIHEWVDGTPVDQWMADPRIPEAERARAARRLSGLVQRMHARRLSHGDLKPRNILIAGGRPVLIDLDAVRSHRFRWSMQKRIWRDWRNLVLGLKQRGVHDSLIEAILPLSEEGPHVPLLPQLEQLAETPVDPVLSKDTAYKASRRA